MKKSTTIKMQLVAIMRGVSGSGKSTFINTLADMMPDVNIMVHSTDDLWMVDGKYCFDFKLLGEKHRQNADNFKESLEIGIDVVICDNTNIRAREYNKYVTMAKEHNYKVIEIVFYPSSLKDHVARNTHNVPEDVLDSMRGKLLKNLEDVQFDEGFIIDPKQGGKDSVRIKNIIGRIIENYK